MSWEIIEGNWSQFKGHVKHQWDVLTDDHLDSIAGKRDHLIGKIQENYGIGQQEAEGQVQLWEDRNQDVFAETVAAINKLPKHLQGT